PATRVADGATRTSTTAASRCFMGNPLRLTASVLPIALEQSVQATSSERKIDRNPASAVTNDAEMVITKIDPGASLRIPPRKYTLTSMTRTARQTRDQRREQALSAAREEFARAGMQGSVDLIADRAGVTPSYLLRLFGTKKALFLAVVERAFEQTLSEYERAAKGKT